MTNRNMNIMRELGIYLQFAAPVLTPLALVLPLTFGWERESMRRMKWRENEIATGSAVRSECGPTGAL